MQYKKKKLEKKFKTTETVSDKQPNFSQLKLLEILKEAKPFRANMRPREFCKPHT